MVVTLSKYSEAHKLCQPSVDLAMRGLLLYRLSKMNSLEGKMIDKVFIVTGASAGIGKQAVH